MLQWKYSRPLLSAFLFLIALAPLMTSLPLGKPGLQQTMAVAFIWGALALTYDLLFGFTGLLSFGHALYFATGVYVSCILINHEIVPWWLAAIISIVVSALLATLVGLASLRTTGITFAMVTLAFGEAGHVIVNRNFFNLTGGENGIALNADYVPQFWIGVFNTKYIYWTALLALVITYLVIWWVTESSAGRVFAALRDNEQRVQVLGLNTQHFKLLSFVISASLAAMLGFVMLIAAGSAAPRFAESSVTIALLLMVVIGGAVSRWGAVLGGIFYSFASTRMQDLTQQEAFKTIPKWIGGPIAEPALLLGLIFIFIVMFSPGGISGAYYRLRMKTLANKEK